MMHEKFERLEKEFHRFKDHKGKLTVGSSPGKETTFTITLPGM